MNLNNNEALAVLSANAISFILVIYYNYDKYKGGTKDEQQTKRSYPIRGYQIYKI